VEVWFASMKALIKVISARVLQSTNVASILSSSKAS